MSRSSSRAVRAFLLCVMTVSAGCGGGPTHATAAPSAALTAPQGTAPAPPPSAQGSPGGEPSPVPEPARPPGVPDPAAANWSDATAVSRAVAITMAEVDTATDDPQTSDHDAGLRALPYLTPRYAAQIRAQQPPPVPMTVWQQWERHRAYLRATVAPGGDDQPPGTATTAYRVWEVTTIPTGRDGWRGQPVVTVTDFVTLVRARPGQPWKVASVTRS